MPIKLGLKQLLAAYPINGLINSGVCYLGHTLSYRETAGYSSCVTINSNNT